MYYFPPETALLNSINIPKYVEPVLKEKTLSQLTLETDSTGVSSIIKITDGKDLVIPYIDLSKYDHESRDWYHYDSRNTPVFIRLGSPLHYPYYTYNKFNIGKLVDGLVTLRKQFDKEKRQAYVVTIESEERLYYAAPILLTINGVVINDVTDYVRFSSPKLTNVDVVNNKEFFYDFGSRIYTNQSLTSYDPDSVVIYYYENPNTISVKSRISSNIGVSSSTTPIIDYYILKLRGQDLR